MTRFKHHRCETAIVGLTHGVKLQVVRNRKISEKFPKKTSDRTARSRPHGRGILDVRQNGAARHELRFASMGEMIEFASNGATAGGYLAAPASGRGPGVIVIQEWWGLVDHIKEVCERF